MGEENRISGRAAIWGGALTAFGAAHVMVSCVLERHYQDGIAWSDLRHLIEIDWFEMRGWRPAWWQGWLWWSTIMVGGCQAVRIGRRIRRAELDQEERNAARSDAPAENDAFRGGTPHAPGKVRQEREPDPPDMGAPGDA